MMRAVLLAALLCVVVAALSGCQRPTAEQVRRAVNACVDAGMYPSMPGYEVMCSTR